jgi:hypothetical protein
MFSVRASAPHVPLRGDRVPSTDHRACLYVRDLQDDGALGCVDYGAGDAGSREESAGAAAAARVLCCALRLSFQCLRALCVWRVLQETLACFQVRCSASQRLHQARHGVHSCVQAAAAARVAGGRDILESAENGDGVSVLCHLIADADGVNERDKG